jgi:hypothetical protein
MHMTGLDVVQAAELYRMLLIRIDTADGQPVWLQRYDAMSADALR